MHNQKVELYSCGWLTHEAYFQNLQVQSETSFARFMNLPIGEETAKGNEKMHVQAHISCQYVNMVNPHP